jgi:hypothetical protein
MNIRPGNNHRRGSLLVVVMGLIVLMLGLTLGLASRVSKGIEDSAIIQRQAQAGIMLLNAKILIQAMKDKSKEGDLTNGVTLGDQVSDAKHPYVDRLGWVRLKGDPSTNCQVLATGGSGGKGGNKSSSLASGNAVANAFDCSYLFTVSTAFAAPPTASTFTVTSQAFSSTYSALW